MKQFFRNSYPKHLSSSTCDCGRSQLQKAKIKMELFQGKLKYCSIDRKSNRIFTTKYKTSHFLPTIVWNFFKDIANLYYLSVLIYIETENNNNNINIISNAKTLWFGLIFSFTLYLVQEFIINRKMQIQNQNINERKTIIFNPKLDTWETVAWKDVQIGNLIYLKKCDICPADILILDAENRTYVNTANVDGSSFSARKLCPISTLVDKSSKIKGQIQEYSKTLSFELQYDSSNEIDDNIEGYLKMASDPKGDEISQNSIIFREAILLYTEWLIGIVLYAGMDCHIFKNTHYQRRKKDQIEKVLMKLYLITLMINFILISLSVVVFLADFRLKLPIEAQNTSTLSITGYYLILYLPLMPQMVFSCLHFLRSINAILMTREIQKTDPLFSINDLLPLANGAQIEHVFIDKTSIISQKVVKLDEFLTREAYFMLDFHGKPSTQARKLFKAFRFPVKDDSIKDDSLDLDERKLEISLRTYNFSDLKNQNPNISLRLPAIEEEQINNGNDEPESPTPKIRGGILKLVYASENSFPFHDQATKIIHLENVKIYPAEPSKSPSEEIFDQKAFKNAVKEHSFGVHDALFSVLLCSQMRVYPEHDNQNLRSSIWDNCYSDEISLMKLCHDHDYIFLNRSKDVENRLIYVLQIKGQLEQLNIAGINDYTHERGRYSIVTFNPKNMDDGGTLFVKGLAHKMTGVLKAGKQKFLVDEVIAEGEKSGKQYLIYATKRLSKDDLVNYLRRYGALKTDLVKKTDEQNKFFNSIECDLQHLALISIENSLLEGVQDSIETFHKLGIKIWLVSGDTSNRVLSTAYLSNIINPSTELWRITGRSLDEVEVSLKMVLENLQDILRKKTNEKQASFEPLNPNNILPNYKIIRHFSSTINNDKKSINVTSNNSLMISGESVDLILQNPYLYYHFCFICNFCQVIIGFKIKPWHKAALIKLIRESDIAKPLIMAIGNGYNDIQMLQESDFSVEIKGDSLIMGLNAADISIGNWKVLNEVFLVHCRKIWEKLEQSLFFLFYMAFLFGMTLLMMNAYNGFAGLYSFNSLTFFEYQYWASLVPVVFTSTATYLDPYKLKNNVGLYKETILRKFKHLKNLIIVAYIPAFWNSLLVMFLISLRSEELALDNGMGVSENTFALSVFITVVAIANLRLVFLHKQQKSIKFGSLVIISVFFMLLSLVFGDYNTLKEIYHSKQIGFLVFFIISVVVELNLFYDRSMTQNLFYRIYCNCAKGGKSFLFNLNVKL